MALPSIALALAAKNSGGFTYRPSDGTVPIAGFAVGIAGHERKLAKPTLDAEDVDDYWQVIKGQFASLNVQFGNQACVGAWFNEGTWYLDVSIVVPSLDQALRIARAERQLAVYSLEDKTEVPVAWDHG